MVFLEKDIDIGFLLLFLLCLIEVYLCFSILLLALVQQCCSLIKGNQIEGSNDLEQKEVLTTKKL